MTAQDFLSLGLAEPLLRALAARNYTTPTPIQARTIPQLLEGRDLLGIAQTGTGKTAAFALPMLQLLHARNRRPRPRMPRALVLAPTRELATQIADSCEAYGKHLHLKGTIVFGGVGQNPQVQALLRGVDILVATPGRLLDLIQQRHCDLREVEILVLDEADRMLDMGFLPDVKRILSTLPTERQSLLFSATMPSDITALAAKFLRNPVRVEVTPPAATADRIEQSVYFVPKARKRDLLVKLLSDPQFERTLVFTRTKHGADRVVKELRKADIEAHAIHGNKSQNARERALDQFRDGTANVLVATDIAARGIDVPEITHVINFDLPNIPESYVHRIGRTARAGRDGIAISFCDEEEREFLRDIEKLIRKRVPVAGNEIAERARANATHAQPPKAAPAARTVAPAAASSNPWQERSGFGADIEVDHDTGAPAEPVAAEPEDRGPRQRQRPDPRRNPGPYAPTPGKPKHSPTPAPLPRHERNRLERERKPKGRPAMPNAVDPEQRRNRPGPMDEQYEPQPQPQRGPAPASRPQPRPAAPNHGHHGGGQGQHHRHSGGSAGRPGGGGQQGGGAPRGGQHGHRGPANPGGHGTRRGARR
jgi:ATP-dependent RNA helicase RhlE